MLCGMDLQAYLRHMLDRIPDHAINRIDELLLWAVAPELAAATISHPNAMIAI